MCADCKIDQFLYAGDRIVLTDYGLAGHIIQAKKSEKWFPIMGFTAVGPTQCAQGPIRRGDRAYLSLEKLNLFQVDIEFRRVACYIIPKAGDYSTYQLYGGLDTRMMPTSDDLEFHHICRGYSFPEPDQAQASLYHNAKSVSRFKITGASLYPYVMRLGPYELSLVT